MQDPLVSQSLPRLGCLWGTFSEIERGVHEQREAEPSA
jgi:hypothetical protein